MKQTETNRIIRWRRTAASIIAPKITRVCRLALLALLALPLAARAQSDATLAYLTSDAGDPTPPYDAGIFNYTLDVPAATASLIVYALPIDPNATLTINGNLISYGNPSPALPLIVGDTVITNMVVSPDMTVTNIYLLTVTRSSFADLLGLTLSSGTLAPAFSSSKGNYNATVPYGTNVMNAPFPSP